MRIVTALVILASPSPLLAQIAPGSQPDLPPALRNVTIRPAPAHDREIDEARAGIHEGRKGGTLTKGQARKLRREVDRASDIADRSARDGVSYSEQREADMSGRAL